MHGEGVPRAGTGRQCVELGRCSWWDVDIRTYPLTYHEQSILILPCLIGSCTTRQYPIGSTVAYPLQPPQLVPQ